MAGSLSRVALPPKILVIASTRCAACQLKARHGVVVVVLPELDRTVVDCGRLVLLERGRIVRGAAAAAVAASPDLDRVIGVRFERTTLAEAGAVVLTVAHHTDAGP